MLKEASAKDLTRWLIPEKFNLDALLDFLKKNHQVNQDFMMKLFTFHMLSDRWCRVKSNDSAKSQSNSRAAELLLIGFLRCQYCFRYQAYKYILLFCVYYAAEAHIFLRQNGHDGEYSNHSRIQS